MKKKVGTDAWSNFGHMGFWRIAKFYSNPMFETEKSSAMGGKSALYLPIFCNYFEEEMKVSFICNAKNHMILFENFHIF